MADITGCLGFTVSDRGLVYVKGGAAWAGANIGINQSVVVATNFGPGFVVNGAISGSASKNVLGATLGAGVEYAFMPGWSAKVEYDYDFGNQNTTVPVTASAGIAINNGPPLPAVLESGHPLRSLSRSTPSGLGWTITSTELRKKW